MSVTVAPELQGEPVTGTFDQTDDPEQVLQVVATTLGAELRGNAEEGFQLIAVE